MEKYVGHFISPIGILEIQGTDDIIYSVLFVNKKTLAPNSNKLVRECINQLSEYFRGVRKEFDLPYTKDGTEFRQKVWGELKNITYGKTTTYGSIASKIGEERAVRAVGTAIGKNQIAILTPCHRVVGRNGGKVSYAWGPEKKEWLLQHEAEYL